MIKEFHLFAGIGGGIYGGRLLGHICCGGVEIDTNCQKVLKQRQADGWMDTFPIYGDLTKLSGQQFKGTFDVLCGGFPCQAFSHAAHGKNISEKNLWSEMYRFVQESDAPIVFGENVTLKAVSKAKKDLEQIGYKVELCRLSCSDLGADHRRNRFWILAVKYEDIFHKLVTGIVNLPKLNGDCWTHAPYNLSHFNCRVQLKAIGNAQCPLVAATAFRILVNRHINHNFSNTIVDQSEIDAVFDKKETWIQHQYGRYFGLLHTPTTMANYSAPSMMKHQGCRNFKTVFGRPTPDNAEWLMAFPPGASSIEPMPFDNFEHWLGSK